MCQMRTTNNKMAQTMECAPKHNKHLQMKINSKTQEPQLRRLCKNVAFVCVLTKHIQPIRGHFVF